jgi:hypothetical protein
VILALWGAVGAVLASIAFGWAVWTPSRNILCGAETGAVICQIVRQDVSRGVKPCDGVYSFVGVVKSHGAARLRFGCYSGVPMNLENAKTVIDGESSTYRGVTCKVAMAGLRCTNRSSHGFFLSRNRIYRF